MAGIIGFHAAMTQNDTSINFYSLHRFLLKYFVISHDMTLYIMRCACISQLPMVHKQLHNKYTLVTNLLVMLKREPILCLAPNKNRFWSTQSSNASVNSWGKNFGSRINLSKGVFRKLWFSLIIILS